MNDHDNRAPSAGRPQRHRAGNPTLVPVVKGMMRHELRPPDANGPRPPTQPPHHAGHDRFLVVSLLDSDVSTETRSRGEALVASCPACSELLADLRGIAAATAAMPIPPRPRDFRLTPETAARLRPRGWRRLVATLGAPRLGVVRPLGAAMATVGLAGLLLTATPLGAGLLGGATTGPEANPAAGKGSGPYELSQPDQVAASPAAPAAGAPSPEVVAQGEGMDRSRTGGGTEPAVGPRPGLGLLFGFLAVLGLGLLVLRLAAERAVGLRAPPR